VLLILVLAFHGPLHPDLEVQMARIAESAARWTAVHWTAAASLSCFVVAALLVLVSSTRLTSTASTMSAWAMVCVGALWTLTTAVAEATVIADLAAAGDSGRFEAWWSFAEGNGNGFSVLAVSVAVIAWNEMRRGSQRLVPRWSAVAGAGAGIASFAGWVLGVWLNIGPGNVLWVIASVTMCLWLAWLGTAMASTTQAPKTMG
jgi:hypothetical protein